MHVKCLAQVCTLRVASVINIIVSVVPCHLDHESALLDQVCAPLSHRPLPNGSGSINFGLEAPSAQSSHMTSGAVGGDYPQYLKQTPSCPHPS